MEQTAVHGLISPSLQDKLSAIAKSECLAFTIFNTQNEIIFTTDEQASPGDLLGRIYTKGSVGEELYFKEEKGAREGIYIYGFKYGLLVCKNVACRLPEASINCMVNLLAENLRLSVEQSEKELKMQQKEKEINKQRSELLGFYRIYNALGVEMELDMLLTRIMQAIQTVLKTEIGSLYLTDEEGNYLIPRVVTGEKASTLRPIKLGESISGWVAQYGKAQMINDLSNDDRFTNPLHRTSLRAQLCVPLKIKNKVIGVINVFNKESEGNFDREDLQLLSIFSAQISAAIERAKLYENEQLKLKRLTMLYELERTLHAAIDFETLTLHLVEKLSELALMEDCLLFLWDDKLKEYILHARSGVSSSSTPEKTVLPTTCPVVRDTIANHKPVYIENCVNNEALRFLPQKMSHLMLFPLVVKEKTLGVIVLASETNGYLEADHRQMLEIMITQVTNALERAKLYHDLQENLRSMQVLLNISEELNSIYNEDDIIAKIMEKALEMPAIKVGDFILCGEEKKKKVYRAGDELTAAALDPDLIPGYSNREMHLVGQAAQGLEYLAIPLKMGSKALGMFVFYSQGKFTERDINFFILLAKQAGEAVENARLYNMLREEYFSMIQSLANAIEAKDPYTMGHSERVQRFALMIGETMNLEQSLLDDLRVAAILHDIGKIGIDEQILAKSSQLSEEEYAMVKNHPLIAKKILGPQENILGEAIKAVIQHHERIDGKGYPYGEKEEICILARILAVADAYDAMTSHRPYRPPYSQEKAVKELKRCSNTQFDGQVVDVFLQALQAKWDNLDNTQIF